METEKLVTRWETEDVPFVIIKQPTEEKKD